MFNYFQSDPNDGSEDTIEVLRTKYSRMRFSKWDNPEPSFPFPSRKSTRQEQFETPDSIGLVA